MTTIINICFLSSICFSYSSILTLNVQRLTSNAQWRSKMGRSLIGKIWEIKMYWIKMFQGGNHTFLNFVMENCLTQRKQSSSLNWKHSLTREETNPLWLVMTCLPYSHIHCSVTSTVNITHKMSRVTQSQTITYTCHTQTQYGHTSNNTFSISHSQNYFTTDCWQTHLGTTAVCGSSRKCP